MSADRSLTPGRSSERLECWSPRAPTKRVEIDAPTPTALAVDAEARIVCAADAEDTVRCHDLEDRRPPRELQAPGLRQLIAVGGGVCAVGERVLCWRGSSAARELPELAGAERVFAAGGHLCGDVGGARRCSTLGEEASEKVATLLAK